ncbi:MAG: SLC13 family permease [Bacteroidales bacterium]|nr:SLC13 family permease [Bacteroidales bacterium]
MGFEGILVLVVIAFILLSLYLEITGPSFTFLIGIIVIGIAGILSPREILSGFANQQIAVIILLLILGDIVRRTGVLDAIFDGLFQYARSYKAFMARMMAIVGVFSAFLNNTPLVAIMMPYVHNWSKRNNFRPSKLLIPLSYAAILGGCATLIGTSTNLIVNGLVVDQKIIPDLEALDLFDFVYVGAPMMVIGFFYMLIWGDKLLPNRADVISSFSHRSREYVVEAQIRSNSKYVGKSVEEANLRNLKGLFLVEILRGDQKIAPVSPTVILKKHDVLIFAGETETIIEMINTNSGLVLTQVGMFTHKTHTEVREAVVSHNSTLINKTVKDANFRGKYDAAIIAIHRNGERISGKIGTVKLKAGDVLLLLTGEDFIDRANDTQDFYLISKIRDFRKLKFYKIAVLLGGFLAAIILSAFKLVPLFLALTVLLILVLALKIASPKDIPKSIDYPLILVIVLSLALGTAMIKTGVAGMIADFIISIFRPFGSIGLLTGIYAITAILGAYITNKAAVAIIFPISLTTAVNLGADPMPFVLVVSFAAAANFMTPIGYQTNLMVYGPGGYSFKDFFKIGFPLTILYMIVTVVILSYMYLWPVQ